MSTVAVIVVVLCGTLTAITVASLRFARYLDQTELRELEAKRVEEERRHLRELVEDETRKGRAAEKRGDYPTAEGHRRAANTAMQKLKRLGK